MVYTVINECGNIIAIFATLHGAEQYILEQMVDEFPQTLSVEPYYLDDADDDDEVEIDDYYFDRLY